MTAVPETPAAGTAVPPTLELRDVDAGYGPFRAIFGVSLAVPAGGVLAILGSNGSGKTTIARVASGLIEPTNQTKATISKKQAADRGRHRRSTHQTEAQIANRLLSIRCQYRCTQRRSFNFDACAFGEYDVAARPQEILIKRERGRIVANACRQIAIGRSDTDDPSYQSEAIGRHPGTNRQIAVRIESPPGQHCQQERCYSTRLVLGTDRALRIERKILRLFSYSAGQ